MELLDGKKLAKAIKAELKEAVDSLREQGKRLPFFQLVLVGENEASQTYIRYKVRACEQVGFQCKVERLNSKISQRELLVKIMAYNSSETIDGILVQMPLPSHLDEEIITQAISPQKDVDGLHPMNIGLMSLGLPALIPPTPAGIIEILRAYDIPIQGKHCVVIGRSNLVGRPTSILLSRKLEAANGTVTLCHSQTPSPLLRELCLQADILVVAAGVPELVKADMVKKDVVIIDVGSTWVPSKETKSGYRVKGDIDWEGIEEKSRFITPVPGGVGPMTICMLLKNLFQAYQNNTQK